MKPLVIYVDMTSDKITLTKKQFEEYLRQAYDQGYAGNPHYYPYTNPSITWTGSPNWTNTTSSTTLNNTDSLTDATSTTATTVYVKGE